MKYIHSQDGEKTEEKIFDDKRECMCHVNLQTIT